MKYVIVIVFLSLFMHGKLSAQTPALKLPEFSFTRLDHSIFTNKNIPAGKMLFFMFFDPSCDHCQHAAANFNEHYTEYKNAEMYLISTESKDKINEFINKYAPALKDKQNITLLQDAKNEFVTKFDPIRVPAMYLYSPDKKLVDYEDNAESMFRFFKYLKAPIK